MSLPTYHPPAYTIVDVPRDRQYTDIAMESGKLAVSYLRSLITSYETTITKPELFVAHQFDILANQLRQDTYAMSNPNSILVHPAFDAIKSMDSQVVLPLIYDRLDREPALWLTALPALTGQFPVKSRHRGRVPKMLADWKTWYREARHLRKK